MVCNCIQRIENELLEKAKENEKFKELKDITVSSKNMAFIFGDKGKVSLEPYMEFEIKAPHITKSGNERMKKESINVIVKFCPFCGKEIK